MKAIPAVEQKPVSIAAAPATPRSAVVTAVSWAVRIATITFVVLAGLLLIQSFRAVFDRTEAPPFTPQADPRDPTTLFPRSYSNLLEGSWTVAEGDWALSWRTTATPLTTELQTAAAPGPPGNLERAVLGWLAAAGPSGKAAAGPDHVVQLASMRIEARTTGDGDARRLSAARLIRPSDDGRWTAIECEPIRGAKATAATADLLPLPPGCTPLARRTDATGKPVAELVACSATDPAWRSLLIERGWSIADLPPPDSGLRAGRDGCTIRVLSVNSLDLPLANHSLILIDPEADEVNR